MNCLRQMIFLAFYLKLLSINLFCCRNLLIEILRKWFCTNTRNPEWEKLDKIIYQAAWGRDKYYNEEVAAEAEAAVHQRFLFEQAERTKEVIDELCSIKGIKKIPKDIHSVLTAADYIDGGHSPRRKDAHWHISYYSESGKNRIENVLKKIGCKNYSLYPGIDNCIASFREKEI